MSRRQACRALSSLSCSGQLRDYEGNYRRPEARDDDYDDDEGDCKLIERTRGKGMGIRREADTIATEGIFPVHARDKLYNCCAFFSLLS